uniref:Uncharacterized protein n=1 Tax=Rhizophora mucronata TaxID=61149 RepID=A0A2P2JZ67_RHIMU
MVSPMNGLLVFGLNFGASLCQFLIHLETINIEVMCIGNKPVVGPFDAAATAKAILIIKLRCLYQNLATLC